MVATNLHLTGSSIALRAAPRRVRLAALIEGVIADHHMVRALAEHRHVAREISAEGVEPRLGLEPPALVLERFALVECDKRPLFRLAAKIAC